MENVGALPQRIFLRAVVWRFAAGLTPNGNIWPFILAVEFKAVEISWSKGLSGF